MRLLRNYVLTELAAPFVYSSLLICSFLIFGITLSQIRRLDLPLVAVGRVGMWVIPEMLTYALPMSFLLACLMGFGRLAGDREILAMKACGVNIIWLAAPVNGIAMVVAVVLVMLNFMGLPRAKYRARWEAMKIARLYPARIIPEGQFIEVFEGIRLYVERKDPKQNRLLQVRIEKEDVEGNKILVQAASAEITGSITTNNLEIVLNEGSVTEVRADNPKVLHKMDFQTWSETLTLGDDVLNPKLNVRPDELSIPALKKKINGYLNDPDEAVRQYKRLNDFKCWYYMRWSRPFVMFVFSLVGIPLAIGGKTGGRAKSFAFGFAVFATYYLLMLPAQTLGEKGVLPPVLAIWMPNIVFTLIGLGLYAKVASE